MKAKLASLALAVIGAVSAPAMAAGSSSGTMYVTFNVISGCNIDYAGDIWNTYDASLGSDLTGMTQTQVSCSSGTAYTLSFNEGQNPGAGSSCVSPQRRAVSYAGSGSYVSYELYQDSNYSQALGCDASNQFSTVSPGGTTWHDVYWRVPGNQANVAQMGYHYDYVVATVTF